MDEIKLGSDVYMRRFYLFGSRPSNRTRGKLIHCVRLHNILRADSDREFHNHPFEWCVSFILSGSYIEARLHRPRETVCVRQTFDLNFITSETFHRITHVTDGTGYTVIGTSPSIREMVRNLQPVWTLFVCGPLTDRSWGFLDLVSDVFVPHGDFQAHPRCAHCHVLLPSNGTCPQCGIAQ